MLKKMITAAAALTGQMLNFKTIAENFVKSYYNSGREPFIYYYRDKDTKEIDLIMESDGKLFPMEIKKTATPDVRLTRVFNILEKSPLQRGTGAILCTSEIFSAFDKDNLIVPIWMI